MYRQFWSALWMYVHVCVPMNCCFSTICTCACSLYHFTLFCMTSHINTSSVRWNAKTLWVESIKIHTFLYHTWGSLAPAFSGEGINLSRMQLKVRSIPVQGLKKYTTAKPTWWQQYSCVFPVAERPVHWKWSASSCWRGPPSGRAPCSGPTPVQHLASSFPQPATCRRRQDQNLCWLSEMF